MSEKTKFVVETLNTFYESFIIEAENEEEAKRIACDCEYNTSKWLGQQYINSYECNPSDLERFKQLDPYFYEGYASVENGVLSYKSFSTDEVIKEMPITKLYKNNLTD